MMGRNHALWAAASWSAAWPIIDRLPGTTGVDTSDPALFLATLGAAAGAGVIPDLDHPDAHPSHHFGLASKLVAKQMARSAGGHRMATHSLAFAVVLGVASWLLASYGDLYGQITALLACFFCCSLGLALVGPSLGTRRLSPIITLGFGAACCAVLFWRWDQASMLLWVIATGGVICHILCDAVTKGGVPILLPATTKRFKVGLFRVGGPGEKFASILAILGLLFTLYRAIIGMIPTSVI